MNTRTTLILLIVLVALGGYVYWSGRNTPASTDTPSASTTPVVQIRAADVSAVVVSDGTGKQVRVERNGSDWKLTSPSANNADATRVGALVDELAALQATRVITPTGSDLAPYGLATPSYSVQLLKGTTPLALLKIGSKNPDGSGLYLERDGSPTIYLVSSSLAETAGGWLSNPPIQPTPAPTTPPLTVVPTPTK